MKRERWRVTHPKLALDAHTQVLKQPHGNGSAGLEQLEDVVDWGEENCQ